MLHSLLISVLVNAFSVLILSEKTLDIQKLKEQLTLIILDTIKNSLLYA